MLMIESEAKALLSAGGVPVQPGILVRDPSTIGELGLGYPVAVKAQVASGGRGKAGGIARADDPAAAEAAARRILDMRFEGEAPESVLLEPWLEIERELYLSVTVDGRAGGYVLLYAPRGGVDIEAGAPPVRYEVGARERFRAHALREVLTDAEADYALREKVVQVSRRLIDLAAARDCLTVEINPLAVLGDGRLIAADAKVVRDEAAAFRARDVRDLLDRQHRREPDAVRRCLAARLMLVRLDGTIGLISGGAGMTMAVMDMIAEAGEHPACFLDCSANPTREGYGLAFEMLDEDPRVRAILISIFGGATHMERVARVMSEIMDARESDKPVVFRLDGTNADQVPAVFAGQGIENHASIEDAVTEAVRLARSSP